VENNKALGNAWFINRIEWASNADSEMLDLSRFNPRTTVIINQSYKAGIPASSFDTDSSAGIKLVHYGLNDMKYESANTHDGLGVFSEIYYPAGWKAYIDGKETPILRVNYVLRGILIPAGKHSIEFKFHPKTFFVGQKISGISSVILILLILAGLAWELLKSAKQESPAVAEAKGAGRIPKK
jgi:hypothetical protein